MGINLIPPQLKRERSVNYILDQTIFGLAVVFILTLIFSAGLYAYDYYLIAAIEKEDTLISDQQKKAKDLKEVEKKVAEINKKVLNARDLVDKRNNWSKTFTLISQATPKEVQIKSMDVSALTGAISLSGAAISREKIALFKEKLEREGFNNVVFVSSAFNETFKNYSYSLTFELGAEK